jgi:murein DD-endopeptidase MepM/ murein hydrolase activator NlpD
MRLVVVFTSVLSVLVFLSCNHTESANSGGLTAIVPDPVIRFDLFWDSLDVDSGIIRKDQTLSHLLDNFGIGAGKVATLVANSREVYDVRKMRGGKRWWVAAERDTSEIPVWLIYEINDLDYVVFSLKDTLGARIGSYDVDTIYRSVQGEITTSLYVDFERLGVPPNLAVAMANVFNHHGIDLPAYRFDQGDGPDYFDPQGESLRKAFLKSPVEFSRISSSFNKRRFHPVLKRIKPHLGTDYAAAKGTPILSVGDGVVIKSAYTKNNGNYVKLQHNNTYETQYLHMSKRLVSVGDRVKQGETIGLVGSTGLATGPHVCFRFWKDGKQVDHRKEKFPPSTPVRDESMKAFAKEVMRLEAEAEAGK